MSFGPRDSPNYERRKEKAVDLVISNPIEPRDLPVLCERVRTLVAGGNSRIVCDVAALTDPDLRTVDALARLQLMVKRLGGSIRLRGTSTRLEELLALTGLCEVMPLCVEVVRETEEREETLGVEEEADAGDLAAGDRQDL